MCAGEVLFGTVPPPRMGSEGEVGGVWEILLTAPLFFPTVPPRGRSKPGQEAVEQTVGPMSKHAGFN